MIKADHSGGNVILPPFRFIGVNLKISSTKVDNEWWNYFHSLQKYLISTLIFLKNVCKPMH